MSHLTITITLPENLHATATYSMASPPRTSSVQPQQAPRKMPKLIDADVKQEPIVPFQMVREDSSHLLGKMILQMARLEDADLHTLLDAIHATFRVRRSSRAKKMKEESVTHEAHAKVARSLYDEFQKTRPKPAAPDQKAAVPDQKAAVPDQKAAAVKASCNCEVKTALDSSECPKGMDRDHFQKIKDFQTVVTKETGNVKLATCSMFTSYESFCQKNRAMIAKNHLNRYERMALFVEVTILPIVYALSNGQREKICEEYPLWVITETEHALNLKASECDNRAADMSKVDAAKLEQFQKMAKEVLGVEPRCELYHDYTAWCDAQKPSALAHQNRFQRMRTFLNRQRASL